MSEQNKAESSAQSPSQTTSGAKVPGPAQPEPTRTNWKLLLAIIAGVVVFVAILVGILFLAFTYPAGTAVVRDLFIIAMAFTSFLIGILMLVLIFQLQALIALLRNEIKPMLTNANQTVSTVRGTAIFVSDNLVKPTIGFASFIAGVRGVQQALVGRLNSTGKRPGASATSQSQATNQP
jgi:ABC-type dipeptide/oligopeptide/nickel transport system permease component